MRKALVLVLLAACAACGQRAALEPRAGREMPPAPYGRDASKTAEALLDPPQQAVPERNVELRRRSEERADDPFDLPPQE